MKAWLIIIINVLLSQQLPAQPEPNLSLYKNLNEKLVAWLTYCDSLVARENYKTLIAASQKGVQICSAKDASYLSKFYYYTGYGFEYSNNSSGIALPYYEKAAEYARIARNIHDETNAVMRLNYMYYSVGEFAKHDSLLLFIKAFSDTTNDFYAKAVFNGSIGEYYLSKSQYENFIFYKLKAIEYRKNLTTENADYNRENIGVSYLQVAGAYLNMKQPVKAIEYIRYSQNYIVQSQDAKSFICCQFIEAFAGLEQLDSARFYYHKLYGMIQPGDTSFLTLSYANRVMAEYYLDHHLADTAFAYSSKSVRFADLSNDDESKIEAQTTFGSALYAHGEYAKAIGVLESVALKARNFDKEIYRKTQQQLAFSYRSLNNWQQAYQYMNSYSIISDSLNAEAVKKNIAEYEAKYQNKEKNEQIAAKNRELALARTRTFWMITGLVLLVAIAGLLAVIYRNKRKTARTLDRKNKRLAVLNQNLEEANTTKARLFSIISHDLRSPISQVYQFLKLQQLNPKLLNEEQKQQLNQKIQEATGSLLETMEDLLLWSKTQMAGFETQMMTVSLLPAVEQCVHLLQLNSEAKNLLIKNEISKEACVYADAYFLQTILRNLLQNAMKAAPGNSIIQIRFYHEAQQSTLTIQNGGNPFTQTQYEVLLTDAETGKSLSGLGLRLVNELSQKMGAKVLFGNERENGTVATLLFKTSEPIYS